MLERMDVEARRDVPGPQNSDWCVGDAAGRWDVSFTDRLWGTFRRWFGREPAVTDEVKVEMKAVGNGDVWRKAA
jgi:hypothetical protein